MRLAFRYLLCAALTGVLSPSVCAEPWQAKVQHAAPDVAEPLIKIPNAISNWGAQIEYGVANDAIEVMQHFANGDERGWSKAVFVTLQRRFPSDGVTPYLGIGAGYAEGLVTTPSEVTQGALAFKGVLGTEMTLEEGLGAFVEYSYAVSPSANTGPVGSLRSHAWNTGLKLDLN